MIRLKLKLKVNRFRKNPFPQLQATTYNANCSVDSYSESSSPADNLESFDYFGLGNNATLRYTNPLGVIFELTFLPKIGIFE